MRSLAFLLALLVALLLPSSVALADRGWTWPVRGPVLTQFLNGSDPYAAGQHRGIDIGAPVGTTVVATASGTVVYAGVVGSSGLTVAERSGDYEVSYLHLSSVAVRSGDHVDVGERLGAVGVSGTRSVDQPHLHFGVREAADRHAYLDPLRFLAPLPAEDPKPQPTPVPAKEPIAAPAPVVTAPAPASAPDASSVLAPAPHAVPSRAAVPHLVHALHEVGSPRRALAAAPRGVTASHLAARGFAHHGVPTQPAKPGSPAHGPAARLAPAQAPAGAPVGQRHVPGRHGGVDIGWLAACIGLVLAAALLARPASRGRSRPSARAALGMLARAAATPAGGRARQ